MKTSGKYTHVNSLLVSFSEDGADVLEVGRLLLFLDLHGSGTFDDHLGTFLFANV